jgi:CRISPR system Cascade subunit CasB
MPELPNFAAIAKRFENLTPGQKAELRRLATPEEASGVPAFYRLFPGSPAIPWKERIAYLLPWAEHKPGAPPLGQQLPVANRKEIEKSGMAKRLYQIVRASPPNDLNQLRRLLQFVEPKLDWNRFGKSVYYWGPEVKRHLIEEFFVFQSAETNEQGA